MTSASLCYLYNIDILQYVTQNSTCRRQNTLYFIILELISMYTLVSEVHVCYTGHLNKTTFIKAQVAQSVDNRTANLRIVSSSLTVGKLFLSTRFCQVGWFNTNEIKHNVHPRYIGA